MIGFICHVTYINGKPEFMTQEQWDVNEEKGRVFEVNIFSSRQDNDHFITEPYPRFVYFNDELQCYNCCFLFETEQKMIEQITDYMTRYNHTNFPDQFFTSRFGPANVFDAKINPVDVPHDLLKKIKTTLLINDWADTSNSLYSDIPHSTESEFSAIWSRSTFDQECFDERQEKSDLNIDYDFYGMDFYEDELKSFIESTKTNLFSQNFYNAMTSHGFTVDSTICNV